MSKIKYNKIFLWLSFFLITLPGIQMLTGVVKERKLGGVEGEKVMNQPTLVSWKEGQFQLGTEEYINQSIGFRPFFVRLNSQLEYSLFDEINSSVLIGKNKFLFEEPYVTSANGQDFVDEEKVRLKFERFELLRNYLKRNGKELLVLIPPNKARFYEEKLPEGLKINQDALTNYSLFLNHLDRLNIPYIDYIAHFNNQKVSSDYPLFTRCGTHWSMYGATMAADTMLKKLNQMLPGGVNQLKITDVELSTSPRHTDADLNGMLNLYKGIPSYEMAYPKIEYTKGRKPKILSIGDSFFLSFIHMGFFTEGVLPDSEYWWYYSKIFRNGKETEESARDCSLEKELKKYDVVVLCYSESNLSSFSSGFINQAYKQFIK